MLVTGLIFSLQFKSVQTFVAKKAADYLSKELKTKISITGFYIDPFKSMVLENLTVLDRQNDTIASFPKFIIDLNRLSLKDRILDVNTVRINNGLFFLKDYKQGGNNINFIIDYFDAPSAAKGPKKKKFQFAFERIIINNLHFKYKNLKLEKVVKGINYNDIDLTDFNGVLEDLNTKDHVLQVNIKNLNFKEKSGFYLKNLSAFTTIDTNQIELKKLLLATPQSRLTDYYQMRFNSFKDFNNYVTKVSMKARFTDSRIELKDIAFFAPELNKIKLSLSIDGTVSGLVNNLKAKKFSVKAGKATYVKGDFSLKGLPEWEQTFMDMKIDLASANKRDLAEILAGFGDKKQDLIPEIVSKFGNINFKGEFTGFQNDFIAFGEFKTKLGRINSDVNMKIDGSGIPSYVGNIKTYNFNFAELIDNQNFGKITSALYIKGRGTGIKTMKEELNGNIDYIDFNGYTYRNIMINGVFDKRRFDGNLKINDKNVKLEFNGGMNLNPKLPEFNFTAKLKDAKLKTLKIYKDSLKADALFSANFSGANLNNIQGNLKIKQIKLNKFKAVYHIDSLELNASGSGIERNLSIKSDVFHASINGQYDLNTLYAYYKTIAKKYIPSLTVGKAKTSTQIFDFDLRIKRFDAVAAIFIPGLSIEDQAVVIGSFDSKNNRAMLTGSAKKIAYKGITATNIILDEGTTNKQLQAIITADRVDLSENVFIKNVNITNVLRNDSLSLNIKLSDSEDINRLDLNGLVEFAGDTTAKISILPSNVKINSENWEIEDKAIINFDKGKTQINGFRLSKVKQYLTINGILSDDPADRLLLGFKDLNLKTLNPFVKSMGFNFSGNANGEVKIANILKSPKINSDLKVDSLAFNQVYIGNLTDTSSYDPTNNIINLFTNIITDRKETFKVIGNISPGKKELDISVKLNNSNLAVLEPFVNNIVSDLKGSISADLTIKGKLKKPHIKGLLRFNQGQLTVNYLKTSYTLNDKIEIENNKINIDDLQLKDTEGNTAIANGTVDLSNINNPDIQIELDTKNFIALNTANKDNSLYYGKAYATGKFSFRGPTDKMFINIDAKTEKGTVFNLPLNSSETVSDKDFITFAGKNFSSVVLQKTTGVKGLTMSFSLKIDPNSLINIYTALGKLSGRGKADLNLNINSIGDFGMMGDYIIESGNFDFNARFVEVINKRFDIRQGGTIKWTGNPANAQINLKAIFALRANNIADLYAAANINKNNGVNDRVQVEVEMGLSGLLMHPDIKLDIFFPLNPVYKNDLQSYLNDGNNLYTQALSLIIQRRFVSKTGKNDIAQQFGSIGKSTLSEALLNQFNNIISSLNLNFVDINIKSTREASASFKFFNDRIILNAGLVNNTNNANNVNDVNKTTENRPNDYKTSIGREVEIQGLIKKDGSLIGKLANKPPTIQSMFTNPGDPSANINSFGLIYSQQFDSFGEFFKKIIGKYQKELKEKDAAKQHKKEQEAILNENKKKQKR